MDSLQFLNLFSNALRSLPESLGRLRHLRTLLVGLQGEPGGSYVESCMLSQLAPNSTAALGEHGGEQGCEQILYCQEGG